MSGTNLKKVMLWSGEKPLDIARLLFMPGAKTRILQRPDDEFKFLHDCAIAAHRGKLYAAWYNCSVGEMVGSSVIRGRVSADGGKTWSGPGRWAEDLSGRILYVPPAFGVCPADGELYLLVTRMSGCDLVHDCEIFRLDGTAWRSVRLFGAPFLPNTPVFRRSDGKLIVGGRVSLNAGELPVIPAVAIADAGRIDSPWRIVRIQDMCMPPDERNYLPETGLVVDGMAVTAFVRNDTGVPLMYESADGGETWSEPLEHDIPVGASKIGAGLLADGRRYLLTNLAGRKRDALAVFFSKPGEKTFSSAFLLRDGPDESLDARPEWSYPAAVENGGILYVMYTSEKTSAALTEIRL